MKLFISVFTAGMVLALFTQGCSKPGQSEPFTGIETDQVILQPVAGQVDSLSMDSLKGQVVLLDFWASFVPPCLEEGAGIALLQQELAPKGFSVVSLVVDELSDEELARLFEAHRPGSFPKVRATPSVREAFGGVRPLPTKLLLNKNGDVVKSYLGVVPLQAIKSDIEALIAGKTLVEQEAEGSQT